MQVHHRRAAAAVLALSIAASGCARGPKPDAYGNFEANEVVVGAETSGVLVWFAADEGQTLAPGAAVALIDTTQLVLEKAQISAQRAAGSARASEAGQQVDALRIQREIAQRQYERMRRLFAEQAATAQQRDQAEREYRVLGEQIEAARSQQRGVTLESTSSQARVAQIEERIRKSRVRNPIAGTVLATYAERGEFVQTGQPLYKVADLDSMVMRAYVGETDLARVKIGQTARVSIDRGGKRRELAGTVSWVSPEAEFTPTPIQTREERADLVYAVKIRVPNGDDVIKIGMPADVRFGAATAAR
jgi:HlyD family secretion protein